MSKRNIAMAYCTDNEATVKAIEQSLQPSGYQFQLYPCSRDSIGVSLPEQLLEQPSPILLFISDNFLKSAQCMSRGLKLLQDKRQQILPVVIEGVAKDEQSGEWTKISTDFERVSDIIQYINYWQDRYLDLRRQKRQMKDFDENAFNAHLKIMREISSEAGEFLRVLRGMNFLHHAEFGANAYENFFKFTNDLASWPSFKSKYSPVEAGNLPQLEEEEEPPAGLSEIPGISALEERETSTPAEEAPLTVDLTADTPAGESSQPQDAEAENEEAETTEPAPESEAEQALPEEEFRDASDLYQAIREEEEEEEE
ncbi:MAG: hypothetical protein KDC66_06705, partial [Phaeodactylibacter sp.]|nr:hypothetical protein [Phaeodactylibacter sp.]